MGISRHERLVVSPLLSPPTQVSNTQNQPQTSQNMHTIQTPKQRAILLDRDGTLVHASHYPSRPEQLRLYDGIGSYLALLQRQGFRLVVITNQSGIARGYFTENDLERMHTYLREQLRPFGVTLDAIYHCPHHPDGVIESLAIRCDCRKPRPGMLLRAAQDLNLDLSSSWFLGDILDDVEAGNRAGCNTILVDLGTESLPAHLLRTPAFVARNTLHALQIIQAVEGCLPYDAQMPTPDLAYHPASWRASYGRHDISEHRVQQHRYIWGASKVKEPL